MRIYFDLVKAPGIDGFYRKAEKILDQNRKYPKRLLILEGILGIGLTAEFCMLSYGPPKIVRYLILLAAMFVIAWIDWHDRRIPNKILVLLLAARGILLCIEWAAYPEYGFSLLLSVLFGLLTGGGMFLLASVISRGGIGMGDIKLFAVTGSYMGSGSILAVIFLTVMASAVYSVVMLLLKKVKLKEEIPFAPFILVGTVLTMALGM